MSEKDLRDAAKVLRELAEAVITGDGPTRSTEWFAEPCAPGSSGWDVVARDEGTIIAESLYRSEATYIATVHPGVVLALADALDHAADHFYDYNAPHLDTVAALILGQS